MLGVIHDELYQQCGVDQLGRDDVIRNVVVNARVFLDVTALRTAWVRWSRFERGRERYRAMIQKQPSRMRDTNSAAM
jgi:hypothetical protein